MSRVPASRIDQSVIGQAARLIQRGEVVAFPTETVYGLGADATNVRAVAKIFRAKRRPHFDPLIVHVGGMEEARVLWRRCPAIACRLMERFWPGPLTLVLPKTARIPDLVTAALPTVAIRCPDHPVAQALIRTAGCPIAAPSANRFGHSSPTTAQAVEEELGDAVPLILDAGPTPLGIESTVVGFRGTTPRLLRPGGVPIEQIQRLVGTLASLSRSPRPHAPGMLPRHYAPGRPLYLLEDSPHRSTRRRGSQPLNGSLGLLAFTREAHLPGVDHIEVLSRRGDLIEATANFFQALRRLDALRPRAILATPLPMRGLGRALMDRLRRASSGTACVSGGIVWTVQRSEEHAWL